MVKASYGGVVIFRRKLKELGYVSIPPYAESKRKATILSRVAKRSPYLTKGGSLENLKKSWKERKIRGG